MGTNYDTSGKRIKSLEKEVMRWRGLAMGMARASERLLARIDRASGGSPRTRVEESVHRKIWDIVVLDRQRYLEMMKPGLDTMKVLLKADGSRIQSLNSAASKAAKREAPPGALSSVCTKIGFGGVTFFSVRQVGELLGFGSNGGNLSRYIRGKYESFFTPGVDYIPAGDLGRKKMIFMRWSALCRLFNLVARDEPKRKPAIAKLLVRMT